MSKNGKIFFRLILGIVWLCLPVATIGCTYNAENDSSLINNSSDDSDFENEGENNETSNETKIYFKRELPNLTVGLNINLENYIGVTPGINYEEDDTAFTSTILEESDDCAELDGNSLFVYRIGTFYLQVSANETSEVFTLEVNATSNLDTLINFLNGIEDNYTIEFLSTDSINQEYVSDKTYRGTNYFYCTATSGGYILSSNDDSIYFYNLSSIEADDFDVEMPPIGTRFQYESIFPNINTFADYSYWRYDESFDTEDANYSSYNYVLDVSREKANNFVADCFMSTSITSNGITYYPYKIYAWVGTDEIRFIPLYASTTLAYKLFTNPLRIVDIGTTSVSTVENYLKETGGPASTDGTEIYENFTSVGTNYSWDSDLYVYDEDGEEVSPNKGIYKSYFSTYASLLYERKVMENGFWSEDYAGTNQVIPGGVYSTGGKSYSFVWDDESEEGSYVVTGEYTPISGEEESLPAWYLYSNLSRFYLPGILSLDDINEAYPILDSNGDYYFSGDNDGGLSVIKACMNFMTTNSSNITVAFGKSLDTNMTIHFDYDEDNVLIGIQISIRLTLDSSQISGIAEDYRMEFVTNIYDIGTTDFSDILEGVALQIN